MRERQRREEEKRRRHKRPVEPEKPVEVF